MVLFFSGITVGVVATFAFSFLISLALVAETQSELREPYPEDEFNSDHIFSL